MVRYADNAHLVLVPTDITARTSSKLGATCAVVWMQWLLLTARILVMVAETARIRLQLMLEAIKGKLAPWWKAVKNPFVQILASVGVLLSGTIGSLGMLATGVFGVIDEGLGLIGLGGVRRKIFDSLGLKKATDRIDQSLSGVGLGGIITDGDQNRDSGLEPIKQELGMGAKRDGTGVAGTMSSLNPLSSSSGKSKTAKRKSAGKKQS